MAPAVQFFVSGESTVFLVVVRGQGLHAEMVQAATAGTQCQAHKVARSWLSYITDVVSSNDQQGRVILIGTHLDKAVTAKPNTLEADQKCLVELCASLQMEFQNAITLDSQPLFIDALDLSAGRSSVWAHIDASASAMLQSQVVPKFINTCTEWMEQHAKQRISEKWATKERFLHMPLFRDLKANQVLSAVASLRKLGYIIELPSGHIILKPSWFAAAASITLSPEPSKTDGLTNTVQIVTNPNRPGYIMRQALSDRLRSVTSWTELQWSDHAKTAIAEADQLVSFLCEIGMVLVDPDQTPARLRYAAVGLLAASLNVCITYTCVCSTVKQDELDLLSLQKSHPSLPSKGGLSVVSDSRCMLPVLLVRDEVHEFAYT